MADLDIIRVHKADSVAGKSALFKFLQIESKIDQYVEHIAKDAARYGLEAAKSTIPIDTGELRASVVMISVGSMYKIIVPDTIHENSNQTKKLTNSAIAIELAQNSLFKRSKASLTSSIFSPVSQGSPTAGWISVTQSKFLQAITGLQ